MEITPDPSRSAFVQEYLEAKADADRANQRLSKATRSMMMWMEANRRKTVKTEVGEGIAQMTYVQSTRYDIDEKGLRRALTAKVFDKFTTKKLNRAALEKAMDDGEVDELIVAKYLSEHKNKPFVKFSIGNKEDEDAPQGL